MAEVHTMVTGEMETKIRSEGTALGIGAIQADPNKSSHRENSLFPWRSLFSDLMLVVFQCQLAICAADNLSHSLKTPFASSQLDLNLSSGSFLPPLSQLGVYLEVQFHL